MDVHLLIFLDTRDVLYNIYQKITNTSDDEFLTKTEAQMIT
jgi:hypothetical protein